MPDNTDLILRMSSPPDNEWEDLKRYDVDSLLTESQKRINAVVQQAMAEADDAE